MLDSIETIAYVYKWTELSSNRWYIGSRTQLGCHPDDGYITSSKSVIKAIQHNPDNWKREILEIGTPDDIILLEHQLLTVLDAKHSIYSFNLTNGISCIPKPVEIQDEMPLIDVKGVISSLVKTGDIVTNEVAIKILNTAFNYMLDFIIKETNGNLDKAIKLFRNKSVYYKLFSRETLITNSNGKIEFVGKEPIKTLNKIGWIKLDVKRTNKTRTYYVNLNP